MDNISRTIEMAFEQEVDELRRMRDEMRVQAQRSVASVKMRFGALEDRLAELEADLRVILTRANAQNGRRLRVAAQRVARELRGEFEELRRSLDVVGHDRRVDRAGE